MSTDTPSDSHHQQIDHLLTEIRATVDAPDDYPQAGSFISILAALRSEEKRGSASKPGTLWLDDMKNGHIRLAQAQARLFLSHVARTSIIFDLPNTDWPDVPAMAFFQALKLFLDAPSNASGKYEHFGTDAETAARRASHVFAREIICSDRYDVVAQKAALPPVSLELDKTQERSGRRKSERQYAFEDWLALEIRRLRELGMPYERIGVELDISGISASISDKLSGETAAPAEVAPQPSSTSSAPERVRQIEDGRWKILLDDGAIALIPEGRLVALVSEHWLEDIATTDQ